jgi:hypothetical protein
LCARNTSNNFQIWNKIPTNDITEIVCDNDLNNSQDIHLSDYLSKLSSETGFSYQFYKTKNDADLEQNSTTDAQTISADATFYARLKKSGFCDNVATITLKFNNQANLLRFQTLLPFAKEIYNT